MIPGPRFSSRYGLLGVIGEGAAGVVHRALDTELKREVAIKLLKGRVDAHSPQALRFEREAKLLSTLTHPRIARLYDFGEEDGVPYLVTQLCEGQTLQAWMRRGPCSVHAAVALIDQLLDALDHVHAAGIVHRDVKPSNVLVDAAGQLTLTDFGIALDMDATGRLTLPDHVLGTLPYMAPEALREGLYTPASDLYAVGMILQELITGATPHSHESSAVHVREKLELHPGSASTVHARIPPSLEPIMARCLEIDPLDRHRSAQELRGDLARVVRALPRAQVRSGPVVRTRPAASRALGVTTVAVVAACLLAGWVRTHRSPPRSSAPMVAIHIGDEGVVSISVDGASAGTLLQPRVGERPWPSVALTCSTTRVDLVNVPADEVIGVELVAPGDPAVLAHARTRTPEVVRVSELVFVTMSDRLLFDIELSPPAATVLELAPREPNAAASHTFLARTTDVARFEVTGVTPDTEYLATLRPVDAWGGFRRLHLRTRSLENQRAIDTAVARLATPGGSPFDLTVVLDVLARSPDLRALPAVRQRLMSDDMTLAAVTRGLLSVLENLRDPAAGPVLVASLARCSDDADSRRLARALLLCRSPAGPEAVRAHLGKFLAIGEPAERADALEFLSRAALAQPGKQAANELVRLCEMARTCDAAILRRLVRADPARARACFVSWTRRPAADPLTASALQGLARLSEDVDLDAIVGAGLEAGVDPGMRAPALDALARSRAGGARSRLLAELARGPLDRDLLWALLRMRARAAIPRVLELARNASPLRSDALLGLGILEADGTQAIGVLVSALESGIEADRAAASWALGQARCVTALPELLAYAISEHDTTGAGAWALGRLAARISPSDRAHVAKRLTSHHGSAGTPRTTPVAYALAELETPEDPGARASRHLVFPFVPFSPTGVELSMGDGASLELEIPVPRDRRAGTAVPSAVLGVVTRSFRKDSSREDVLAESPGEVFLCPPRVSPSSSEGPWVVVIRH